MDTEISCDSFIIDKSKSQVITADKKLHLTIKELDILMLMLSNPNRVFSKKELLEKVWGYDYYGQSRAVDVQIRRLRQKIEDNPSNPKFILTKWGEGYYFKCYQKKNN